MSAATEPEVTFHDAECFATAALSAAADAGAPHDVLDLLLEATRRLNDLAKPFNTVGGFI